MKAKTIKKIIDGKFHLFKESISDEEVKQLVEKNTIITGGCITSLLLNEDVNDFDLYFRNKETAFKVAEYYVNTFKTKNKLSKFKNWNKDVDIKVVDVADRIKVIVQSAGIVSEKNSDNYGYFETLPTGDTTANNFIEDTLSYLKEQRESKERFRPVFLTSNAVTLSDDTQLIFRFYGEPEEIHKNYDFVHCTNYWDSKTKELILNKGALESILTKELIYQGSLYPLCSVFRIRKFIKRGWTITAGQILKMCFQISELDLTDPKILENQILGVDVAYLHELISKLRTCKDISGAYLFKLIDELL